MPKSQLVPFNLAGVMDYCPECGATGDYRLLAEKVKAIAAANARAIEWARRANNDARILRYSSHEVGGRIRRTIHICKNCGRSFRGEFGAAFHSYPDCKP